MTVPRLAVLVSAVGLVATGGVSGAAPVPACVNQVAEVNDRCETWSRVFNDTAPSGTAVVDTPRGMALNRRGDRLYVATTSAVGAAPTHITVAALKPGSRGATLWVAHAPTPLTTRATAVALVPDDRTVVVTGQADYLPNLNAQLQTYWFTAAFSTATGKPVWSALFRASGKDVPVAVTASGGTVYVTGRSTYGAFTEWNTVAYAVRDGRVL